MNDNYLNDIEKDAIQSFLENKTQYDAVKKVLLATVFHQGTVSKGEMPTEYNWAFSIVNGEQKSDEVIGQEVRASCTAIGYIKSGFEKLEKFRKVEPKAKKTNDAL